MQVPGKSSEGTSGKLWGKSELLELTNNLSETSDFPPHLHLSLPLQDLAWAALGFGLKRKLHAFTPSGSSKTKSKQETHHKIELQEVMQQKPTTEE